MNILLSIANNWHDILVGLLIIFLLVFIVFKAINKFGPILKEMSPEERIAYITRLLENLVPIALLLVTDAEAMFGGGTGKLKRSYVIDQLYKRVPDPYKIYITEDNLDAIINLVLEKAEELWSTPPYRVCMKPGTEVE